jgi:uncharacterized protein DUF1835
VATLHITNGSAAGDKLSTFVDGPVILMCDVLHEGPAPDVDDDAWYAMRARFLGAEDGSNADDIRAGLAASDRAVRDALARGDEIVLWFEHDLFDQLELIRTLDLIRRVKPDATGARGSFSRAVDLICIDRFPGVDRFIGLGQLDPVRLATLYPARRPITSDQLTIAAAAWAAFRSADPRSLVDVASQTAADATARAALPFLGDALYRFLAEYPSVENGLTRTETLALRALADGPLRGDLLFLTTQREEPRPFMGDSTFFEIVSALAAARVPLVSISGPPDGTDLRAHTISVTDEGRAVLAGRADRITLNGIDLWRGGVHLAGADRAAWRWDERRKRLVS